MIREYIGGVIFGTAVLFASVYAPQVLNEVSFVSLSTGLIILTLQRLNYQEKQK